MIFAISTLLTALALAAVAGWFSIIGIMAILAGSPVHALVAGVTIETAKLVTTSWIYRNWNFASWKLKILLMFFTVLIMLVTSMGVFGFLSKAHLEQGASTIDNGAKVVRIEEQITREKSSIADNQKVIEQLDSTVRVLTDAQRIRGRDGSIAVRKGQEEQRNLLRSDIEAAQKRIDALSEQRFALQSEVRKLQLEVGPIRYISEVIFGAENNSDANIESAVRIFILLLVLTLDPLAITLLVAANNTFLRLRNEKKHTDDDKIIQTNEETTSQPAESRQTKTSIPPIYPEHGTDPIFEGFSDYTPSYSKETEIHTSVPQGPNKDINEETKDTIQDHDRIQVVNREIGSSDRSEVLLDKEKIGEIDISGTPGISGDPTTTNAYETAEIQESSEDNDEGLENIHSKIGNNSKVLTLPIIRSPKLSKVSVDNKPWMHQSEILGEILGNNKHFIPKKLLSDEKKSFPKILGWISEFKRTENE